MSTLTISEAISSALAKNTRIAYRQAWGRYEEYCKSQNIVPMNATPQDLGNFFVHLSTIPRSAKATTKLGKPLSMGTIVLCRSAINRKFWEKGMASPAKHITVDAVLRGLMRIRGRACRQVRALREFDMAGMLHVCDQNAKDSSISMISVRDAAILAVGFAGALRRSEICQLMVEDVEFIRPMKRHNEWRMVLHIQRSKTDQEGMGQQVPIPDGKTIRPVTRLKDWLQKSGVSKGPLFQTLRRGGKLRERPMHESDIPRLVKKYAQLIGLDSRELSGHSLRAGFVTSAAVHGARLDKIMAVTRHTNPTTVMKYIRDADVFEGHAGAMFL